MEYVVFDLEFNQDLSSESCRKLQRPCFEIIQIGAVKLNCDLNTAGTFQRFVKPSIYPEINPFVTELTGITTDQLACEEAFPVVYSDFSIFFGGSDTVFCTWGTADLKELYRNVEYHGLDKKTLPKKYVNLQPYAALQLDLPGKKLLKLKTAAEALDIPLVYSFHDALHDAWYTAEIMKKIRKEPIRPRRYDPEQAANRPRQIRQTIDFEGLLQQFEKMYAKELTGEEKEMVRLAYQMGRTRQFIK